MACVETFRETTGPDCRFSVLGSVVFARIGEERGGRIEQERQGSARTVVGSCRYVVSTEKMYKLRGTRHEGTRHEGTRVQGIQNLARVQVAAVYSYMALGSRLSPRRCRVIRTRGHCVDTRQHERNAAHAERFAVEATQSHHITPENKRPTALSVVINAVHISILTLFPF